MPELLFILLHRILDYEKLKIVDGIFMLCTRPYYQKRLLTPGYLEEFSLTAPNDLAFIPDIKLAKAMGFNGLRKHPKIEDAHYRYLANQLGLLVWRVYGL